MDLIGINRITYTTDTHSDLIESASPMALSDTTNSQRARTAMVDSQLRTNRVDDPGIIEAFENIPRELFVADAYKSVAYVDEDLPLTDNRALLEPIVLGRMIQSVTPLASKDVLDLGCGTGYASAIMSQRAKSVVAAESDPALLDHARRVHEDLNLDNVVHTAVEDIRAGAIDLAPFDAIIIGGAIGSVPKAIFDQLAPDGCLIALVVDAQDARANNPATRQQRCQAMLYKKFGDTVSGRSLFDAAALPMPEFFTSPRFSF